MPAPQLRVQRPPRRAVYTRGQSGHRPHDSPSESTPPIPVTSFARLVVWRSASRVFPTNELTELTTLDDDETPGSAGGWEGFALVPGDAETPAIVTSAEGDGPARVATYGEWNWQIALVPDTSYQGYAQFYFGDDAIQFYFSSMVNGSVLEDYAPSPYGTGWGHTTTRRMIRRGVATVGPGSETARVLVEQAEINGDPTSISASSIEVMLWRPWETEP